MNRTLTSLVLVATSLSLTGCGTRAKQNTGTPPTVYVKAADVRLLLAAIKCDTNAMDAALKDGANVNAIVVGSETPLAIMCGCSVDATRLLLDRGADPNVADDKGLTPLLAAIILNRPDMVQLLISRGANVNAIAHVTAKTDSGTLTPLKAAKDSGRNEIVEILVKAGAKE